MLKKILVTLTTLLFVTCGAIGSANALVFGDQEATATITDNEAAVAINWKRTGFTGTFGALNKFGNGDECSLEEVTAALKGQNLSVSSPVGRVGDLVAFLKDGAAGKAYGVQMINCNFSANYSTEGTLMVVCFDKGFTANSHAAFVPERCYRTSLVGFTPSAAPPAAAAQNEPVVIRAPEPKSEISGNDEFSDSVAPAPRKPKPQRKQRNSGSDYY